MHRSKRASCPGGKVKLRDHTDHLECECHYETVSESAGMSIESHKRDGKFLTVISLLFRSPVYHTSLPWRNPESRSTLVAGKLPIAQASDTRPGPG